MQTTTTTKPAKRVAYPYFTAIGLVKAYEHGESFPVITVRESANISYYDEVHGALIRNAKWNLERAGVSKERIAELYFDDVETTDLYALNAKGVRREYGDKVEAFFDGYGEPAKKRDVLIRQRRLVPLDRTNMIEMYGQETAATEGGAA